MKNKPLPSMNDYKKFKHGSEGTHYACKEKIGKLGGFAWCCECNGHKCEPSQKKRLPDVTKLLPIKENLAIQSPELSSLGKHSENCLGCLYDSKDDVPPGGKVSDSPPLESGDWEETFNNWFEEWIDDSGKFLKTTPLSFVKAGVGAVVSEALKSQLHHIREKVETLPRYDVWSSPGGHDVKTEYVKLTDIERLLED